MTQRMFVAVLPPQEVRDEIEEFLDARPGMPWIAPEQWHYTLAFLESVPVHRTDELIDAVASVAARHPQFGLAVGGAGCFPSVERASVLWLGARERPHLPREESHPSPEGAMSTLAHAVRGAANSVGATPDGRSFVPHLTLARLHRKIEATKWLRVLDTFTSTAWQVESISLVASYLREGPSGRPRYEVVADLPLADAVGPRVPKTVH